MTTPQSALANSASQRIVFWIFLLASAVGLPRLSMCKDRPNILWIVAEDTSPWMGCYGDAVNRDATPNIDGLAKRGVRFSRAYVPAPVCSACRSALMGGQSQIRFNAHEHRSSRGPAKIYLPPGMKLLPQLLKENGYFTFNLGKDDYNFVWDQEATYSLQAKSRDAIPWDTIRANQPFFGQIQTAGGKNNTARFPQERKANPAEVTVPEDYPQNQLYRETVAQHYDAIRMDDDFIGTVLEGLEAAGLQENTIVVYFSDHGANNLVRHKQMPTEGGLHVPFIIAGPDPWVPAPSVRDDLVNLLDLSATTLVWADVKIPNWFEGQDLFGFRLVPRTYVAAAKDRLDHTIDRVRSVRSDRFRYTRNYKTDRILLQPQYRDQRPFLVNLHELYATGRLSPRLTEIYFGERPAEEFYDVSRDPCQLHNLIDDAGFAAEIERHRGYLEEWLEKGDTGEGEESLAELAFQASGQKWGEGVNPEYEVVRSDSDGDGLSDDWERINGRDPEDGRLAFHFDCGGWQTEGWRAVPDNVGNIAGRLGFLDFELAADWASLRRDGLQLDSEKNRGPLKIVMQVSGDVKIALFGNRNGEQLQLGDTRLDAGKATEEVSIALPEALWQGKFQALRLDITGEPGTLVQMDSIRIDGP
ncbi:MAG: sulfatase [bacterium]|nr:sulfatase [bacterium]